MEELVIYYFAFGAPVIAAAMGVYILRRQVTPRPPRALGIVLIVCAVAQPLLALAWVEGECVESYIDCTGVNLVLLFNGLVCVFLPAIAVGWMWWGTDAGGPES